MPQSDPDSVAREALRLIGPDPQNWVPEREGIDHNVVVVGGWQSGSAFAFALRGAGIGTSCGRRSRCRDRSSACRGSASRPGTKRAMERPPMTRSIASRGSIGRPISTGTARLPVVRFATARGWFASNRRTGICDCTWSGTGRL